MLTIKGHAAFKLKCPKHPMFNPAKHGPGDIKAGCPLCFSLIETANAVHVATRQIARTENLLAEFKRKQEER